MMIRSKFRLCQALAATVAVAVARIVLTDSFRFETMPHNRHPSILMMSCQHPQRKIEENMAALELKQPIKHSVKPTRFCTNLSFDTIRNRLSKAASIFLVASALSFAPLSPPFASQLLQEPANAAGGSGGGMTCATKHCASELQTCFSDIPCAFGMKCIFSCIGKSGEEGACQVRCMDLHDNEKMRAVTECTMTQHKCIPPLAADPKYAAVLSNDLADHNFDYAMMRGTWFVAAGWNPAFDCFECQRHEFFDPDISSSDKAFDATFSYRIQRDDGTSFARTGDKRLTPLGKGRLTLRLRPERMNYQDDWTVLAAQEDVFMLVHYHGSNVAWDG
jgi:hypothetical protein